MSFWSTVYAIEQAYSTPFLSWFLIEEYCGGEVPLILSMVYILSLASELIIILKNLLNYKGDLEYDIFVYDHLISMLISGPSP